MGIETAAIGAFTLLLPFINAGINRVNWTPKQKSLVAWGTAIVAGTVFVLLTGGISSLAQVFVAIPAIYGYTQAIYTFLVKNIATKFEAITTKDSVVVAPAPEPGTVTVASDVTIKADLDSTPVETPLQIGTDPATEAPVTIVKNDVVG